VASCGSYSNVIVSTLSTSASLILCGVPGAARLADPPNPCSRNETAICPRSGALTLICSAITLFALPSAQVRRDQLLTAASDGQFASHATPLYMRCVLNTSTNFRDRTLAYARMESEERQATSVHLDDDFEAALSPNERTSKTAALLLTHDASPNVEIHCGQMVRLFHDLDS